MWHFSLIRLGSFIQTEVSCVWWELWLPLPSLLVLTVLLPNLWGIWISPRGAKDWGKSTCAGATEGVYVSLFLCACMGTGTNLRWGESTQISIIRGFWGPPLSPRLHFTSLSHHPLCCSGSYPPPSFHSASVTPLSLYPSFSLYTAVWSLSHPALPFTTLTSSAYTHPYHYLLHCRHLAVQLGITSPHPSTVQYWDYEQFKCPSYVKKKK